MTDIKSWAVEYLRNKNLEEKRQKERKSYSVGKPVSANYFNQTNGKKYIEHPERDSYNTFNSISRAKHFDSVFGDLYTELNITPEPLDYIDSDGQKKTYIYKSK